MTLANDEQAEPPKSPENFLWLAVVQQAIHDAVNLSDPRLRNEARKWLLNNSEDFQLVCAWSGLDPDYVAIRARRLAARGWPSSGETS
jgi:hypothetical protein